MARATSSWSKATRSVRLPPPRASTTTSALALTAPMAAARAAGAVAPCTGVSVSNTRKAKPLAASTRTMSAWAALPNDITSPTRSGTGASTAPALRRSDPSAAKARSSASRSAAIAPSVWAGSMAIIRNWSCPRRG